MIVSLSTHLEGMLTEENIGTGMATDTEQYKDIVSGIESIAARSQGLLRFVQTYRSLSNLPRPAPVEVDVQNLIQRLATLLRERFDACKVEFLYSVEPAQLTVNVDLNHLEQILLNLLSNAIDAVDGREQPLLEITAYLHENGNVVLQVQDNGCGIPKSYIEDIFTPFFSTKDTGTGVGLSLSRQLARLNNATLTVASVEGEGSRFQLRFR